MARRKRGLATIGRSLGPVRSQLDYSQPKTEAGERTLELPGFERAALKAQRAGQAQLRLALAPPTTRPRTSSICREEGSPLRPDYETHRFKRLVRDAGLPDGSTPTRCATGSRRSWRLAERGAADIAKVLGHSDGGQLALRV